MQALSAAIGAALLVAATACGPDGPNYQKRASDALDEASLDGVSASYNKSERVVHVRGTVSSESDRQRAGDLVRRAVGTGAQVANEVTIKGVDQDTADDLDAGIETRLKNLVQAEEPLRDSKITFTVNNGVVTIAGGVATEAQKARVETIARSVPGARDVVNSLEVFPRK